MLRLPPASLPPSLLLALCSLTSAAHAQGPGSGGSEAGRPPRPLVKGNGALECRPGWVRKGKEWPHAGNCASEDGTRVLGPFPEEMARACVDSDVSEDECRGGAWPRDLYLALRGSGVCDRGAAFDEHVQRCSDAHAGATGVYGPFPRSWIEACVRAGGGETSCRSHRWSRSLYESIARSAPMRAPLSPVTGLRGAYVSHFELRSLDESGLRALARSLKSRNVNTAYLSVYAEGRPWWPSRVFAAAGGRPEPVDHASLWGRVFREEGLHPVAWFEYGLRVGGPDHPIARAHPEWLQRDARGGALTAEAGTVYLSPGNPDARAFISSLAAELAGPGKPFGEIHLDHFHWSFTGDGREFGYEEATVSAWRAQTGKPAPRDKDDAAWVDFRERQLDSLVRQLRDAVKSARPVMRVTACPEALYAFRKHMKRWPRWLETGAVDGIVAQVYYHEEGLFRSQMSQLAGMARAVGALDRFGVTVDATGASDAARVERQIRLLREEGVFNAALWAYHDYGEGVAIEDNLAHMARAGGVWEAPASQPFR